MKSFLSVIICGDLSALTSAYFLKMLQLATSGKSLAICLASSQHEWASVVHQCMRVSFLVNLSLSNVLFYCLHFFTVLNSLLPFAVSPGTFCAHCNLPLLAQDNTCSLVSSLVFLVWVNSHMISITISSLFMPFIKCSFSLLPYSLSLHWCSFILRQPIYSSPFSVHSLMSFPYCKDNIM